VGIRTSWQVLGVVVALVAGCGPGDDIRRTDSGDTSDPDDCIDSDNDSRCSDIDLCNGDDRVGDDDGDGVCDDLDVCADGRDDDDVDGDGVPGACDDCAGTPAGTTVGDDGCPVQDTDDTDDTGSANQDPTIANLQLTGNPGLYNDAVLTCSGTFADPDGSITGTTYTFRNVTRAATIASGSSPQVTLVQGDHAPGDTIACDVAVVDNDSAQATDTVQVVLEDRAPVITDPTITADPEGDAFNDSELTCSATVVDPDGTTPPVTYAWDNQTTVSALGTGDVYEMAPAVGMPGDVIRCTVTADDGLGTEVSESVTVTLANRLPVVTEVEILEPVYTTSEAECTYTAVDPDGDAIVGLSVSWRDGVGTGLGTGQSLNIGAAGLQRGDSVICAVTASDGSGQGAEVTDSAIVGNRAPVAVNTFLNPDGAHYGEVVTCQSSFTDPDGDDLGDITFTWTNETTGETLATNADTYVMTGKGVAVGDTLRCTATVSDGDLETEDTAEVVPGIADAGHPQEQGELGVVRYVPSGSLSQGCVKGRDDVEGGCDPAEIPPREVVIGHGLWMMQAELTEGAVAALGIDDTSADVCGTDCPSESMSWLGAVALANAASEAMGLTPCYDPVDGAIADPDAETVIDCEGWRLPTEAEWERAARADSAEAFAGTPGGANPGWHADDTPPMKREVCTSGVNAWGMCDMAGNVWEWVHDTFAPYDDADPDAPLVDPVVFDPDDDPARKGGGWGSPLSSLRTAKRLSASASGSSTIGARLVRTIRASDGNTAPVAPQPSIQFLFPGAGMLCSAEAAEGTDADGHPITYRTVMLRNGRPTGLQDVGTSDPSVQAPFETEAPGDTWTCRVYAQDAVGGLSYAEAELVLDADGGDARSSTLGGLRYVPSGTFTMGCVEGRDDLTLSCDPISVPPHEVALTRPFWMTQSEITQRTWGEYFDDDPSAFGPGTTDPCGPDCPVENVNWWEAARLANEASTAEGLRACYTLVDCTGTPGIDFTCDDVVITAPSGDPQDCEGYRMPTEAEWEYAARAGENLEYGASDDPDEASWYGGNNDPQGTKEVCGKLQNAWGLCDMVGNVREWTTDWAQDEPYSGEDRVDPLGPVSGTQRRTRGGDYNTGINFLRLTKRIDDAPDQRLTDIGIRLVRSAYVDPENQPPDDPQASALPTTAGDLECSAAAAPEDPEEGDAEVRVVWRRNGEPTKYQDQAPGNGPIVEVPGFELTPGHLWTCDVIVSDGENPPRGDTVDLFVDGVPGDDDRLETAALGVAPWVPAGDFSMGCFAERDGVGDPATCGPGEDPPQEVRISQGMWVMEAEVKQSWWNDLMPDMPVGGDCVNCPATGMSWYAALQFANRASEAMGLDDCYVLQDCSGGLTGSCVAADPAGIAPWDCKGWRLPTEAEWEYLARGGLHNTALTSPGNIADIGWYVGNSDGETKAACSTVDPFNDFALCDMAGNAAEWTWDAYESVYPGVSLAIDPYGPFAVGGDRVVRGGSYLDGSQYLRNASRDTQDAASGGGSLVGFRLVRTAPGPGANQPPTMPSLTLEIEKNGPTAGEIMCDTGAVPTDPDGDPVLMRTVLLRDGVPTRFQDNRYSGSTSLFVDAAITRSGEEWTCRVVAHDGLGPPQVVQQTDTVP